MASACRTFFFGGKTNQSGGGIGSKKYTLIFLIAFPTLEIIEDISRVYDFQKRVFVPKQQLRSMCAGS